MGEWRKYKRTAKHTPKPPCITFAFECGAVLFRSNISCFKDMGLNPDDAVCADLYFKDGEAAIVPHGNGEITWRTGTSAGTAFRDEGWDVSPGTKYKCKAGRLYGEPALRIQQADKL